MVKILYQHIFKILKCFENDYNKSFCYILELFCNRDCNREIISIFANKSSGHRDWRNKRRKFNQRFLFD